VEQLFFYPYFFLLVLNFKTHFTFYSGKKEILDSNFLQQFKNSKDFGNFHGRIIQKRYRKNRKYTKNKLSFPTDEAVKKSVFLAFNEVTKKWTRPIRNCGLILSQFLPIFEVRIKVF
jgi:hypothetical protein